MTLAILLIGLIVATCIIAYLADTLGKNLGKKRVTLKIGRWNLRPRQTATLLSMASSVAVMLFTVGILLLTSKSLSNALLRYDAARWEANRNAELAKKAAKRAEEEANRASQLGSALESEIKSKRDAIRKSEARLQNLRETLRGTSTQLTTTRARLDAATRARNAAVQNATQARRAYGVLRSQLQSARAQFNAAQKRLRAEQKNVDQANARLKKVQALQQSSQVQIEAVNAQLVEATRLRDEARAELNRAQAAFAQAQKSFQTAETSLKTTLAELEKSTNELAARQVQLDQVKAELEDKQRSLKIAEVDWLRLRYIAERIATGQIEVAQGSVLGEKTMAGSLQTASIRARLRELLEEGLSTLRAGKSSEGGEMSLTLYSPPFMVNGKPVQLQGMEIVNRLADYIATFEIPVSVRLAAARDHAVGEREIFAQFLAVPIRTVFAEGETLAETQIQSGGGDARIFNQLLALVDQGEAAARSRGVLPLLTRENRYFFAAGTNERIFEALRRIQQLEAPARVRLVAAQNLNTVEPLRVQFEIERE